MPGAIDLLVVGSGVAGLSAAARAAEGAPGVRVGVLSKGVLSDSATQWAQGGIAAVLHRSEADTRHPGDSIELHAADTLRAGGGLCDREAVEVLVREGPERVRELAALGARFDRNERGLWELSREGGHTTARVVHAGGAATGAEIERALVEAARQTAAQLWEGWFAVDLILEGGRCRGVTALGPAGEVVELRATHTLLATGGAGQMFSVTTNPPQSSGDGLAMALRAGVPVADVEFVQFHPTALHGAPAGPRPLMSEALRGEGALLRDRDGLRFVDEMQPRDVVAAAVAERMRVAGVEHLWLDVSGVEDFGRRFPSLDRSARALGLDPPRDWLPVAPAAHYVCGGVVTDLDGATALPGLWAAGEVACTGVHGANRLASNSLLEGMVFGVRVVQAVLSGKDTPSASGALRPVLRPGAGAAGVIGARRLPAMSDCLRRGEARVPAGAGERAGREALQHAMARGAGVVRTAGSLADAAKVVADIAAAGAPAGELSNLLAVAGAVVAAATAREESRGGHRREDYPATSPVFSHRFVQ
ncbi:MAG: L-aspartate oxidase [Acidimicrobiales bacterium]